MEQWYDDVIWSGLSQCGVSLHIEVLGYNYNHLITGTMHT